DRGERPRRRGRGHGPAPDAHLARDVPRPGQGGSVPGGRRRGPRHRWQGRCPAHPPRRGQRRPHGDRGIRGAPARRLTHPADEIAVRINVEMPLRDGASEPEVQLTLAEAFENAGFGALTLTDHPSPSLKWLQAGGHPTFDPFAGLAFYAAVTSRIRLMTH